MLVFRSGRWRWHFSDRAAAEELGPAPEERMLRSSEIRNTGGERIVYAAPGWFFKWERPNVTGLARLRERFFPRAAGEFASLRRLAGLGIRAVVPVAYGVSGAESVLITRAEEGVVPIADYLSRYIDRGEVPPDKFFDVWGELLFALISRHLYIPDFHCGNLLYDETANVLTIVDPPGMRRLWLPRPDLVLRMLKRQFATSIEYLPERVFIRMIGRHHPAPERLFRRVIEYNARYVRHSQLRNDKRLKDFRRGRFIENENGVAFIRRNDGRHLTLADAEELDLPAAVAAKRWEREFVLGLFRVPRLRVVARNVETGKLYRQRKGDAPVDAACRDSLLARLRLAGFDPAEFDFAADTHGRTLLVDEYGSRD